MSRRTKGQRTLIRLSSMNVAQGQSGTKHGAHDKCWLSGPSCRVMLQTVHILTLSHQPRSALCSILAVSAYNMVTGVWPPTVVCWYNDSTCICRIQASFHSSKNLSYNNMLTRLKIRVCFSSEHEGSLNHTTYNPYLQKTAVTRDVTTLDTGH